MQQRNVITIEPAKCTRCHSPMKQGSIRDGLLQSCPQCGHNLAILLPLAIAPWLQAGPALQAA